MTKEALPQLDQIEALQQKQFEHMNQIIKRASRFDDPHLREFIVQEACSSMISLLDGEFDYLLEEMRKRLIVQHEAM